jgi:hypothetical protein
VLNIKVNSSTVGSAYSVNDNLGKVLLAGKINSENSSLDISSLSKGIYFLTIGEHLKSISMFVKE